MTRYLLDTDALIDFSRGIEPASSSIISWLDGSDVVAVCPVTVAEFFAGLAIEEAFQWTGFIAALPYWEISIEAAMHAGQYRYAFARTGQRITITDALLAAVAQEQGATLVTGNVKEFPMRGLSLLSIRGDSSV
jgi:predicted nucleic acid-binding protein